MIPKSMKKPIEPEKKELEPDKPVELDSIKQAREEREKMDTTVEAMKKENDRTEKMHADNIIAGKAVNQGDPVEETPEQYKDRIMRGEE